jgi:hypothetical protein
MVKHYIKTEYPVVSLLSVVGYVSEKIAWYCPDMTSNLEDLTNLPLLIR